MTCLSELLAYLLVFASFQMKGKDKKWPRIEKTNKNTKENFFVTDERHLGQDIFFVVINTSKYIWLKDTN